MKLYNTTSVFSKQISISGIVEYAEQFHQTINIIFNSYKNLNEQEKLSSKT